MDIMDQALNDKILRRLSWRNAIRPDGSVADEPCFVFCSMPAIRLTQQQYRFHVERKVLVSQSAWTSNLIESHVGWDLDDDSTMQALAECQLIFHTPSQTMARTVHLQHAEAYGRFSATDIWRPTQSFQKSLDQALAHWPKDPLAAWQALCATWKTFGFLWPQKYVLGYKHHVRKTYTIAPHQDRMYCFRLAKDEANIDMEASLRRSEQEKNPDTWEIIKRCDTRPIYEFLCPRDRETIQHIMGHFIHRIPLNSPIHLCNRRTSGFLTWRLAKEDGKGKAPTRGNPFRFATVPMDPAHRQSQRSLWCMKWSTVQDVQVPTQMEACYIPRFLRCGNQLYLSPACDPTASHRPGDPSATEMVLTCSTADASDSGQKHRVCGLELARPRESAEDKKHRWAVELTNVGLELDDAVSTEEWLNVDMCIGRRKPIVHGDTITLRQVHYLCSMPNVDGSTASTSPMMMHPLYPPPPAVSPTSLESIMRSSGTSSTESWLNSQFSLPLQSSAQTSNSSIHRTTRHNGTRSRHQVTRPGGTQQQQQEPLPPTTARHPAVAAEHALIGDSAEKLWVIKLASFSDPDYPPSSSRLPENMATQATNAAGNAKEVHFKLNTVKSNESLSKHPEASRGHYKGSLRKVQSLTNLNQAYMEEPRHVDLDSQRESENGSPFTKGSMFFPPVEERESMTTESDMLRNERAQPYWRLYNEKQNSKLVSHLVKRSTLADLGKRIVSGHL